MAQQGSTRPIRLLNWGLVFCTRSLSCTPRIVHSPALLQIPRVLMIRRNRLLIAGILLVSLLIMPAFAEVTINRTADGKMHYANGTYWLTWDRIDNHTTEDVFFVNATTNLTPGTVILYEFLDPSVQCHTKICTDPGTGATGLVTIEKGPVSGINTLSILINTTGFRSNYYPVGRDYYPVDEYYIFDFYVYSSPVPDETNIFPGGYIVNAFINIYPDGTRGSNTPSASPLSITGICSALLLTSGIILWIRRRGKKGHRREADR